MTTAAAGTETRVVVGIADVKISKKEGDLLVTYALGSCLGICIYDPVAKVAGLLHAMLPAASAHKDGGHQPAKFVDTGLTALFKGAYRLGAKKERLIVKVAGGASVANGKKKDSFQIGKRNIMAMKKLFWKNGVMLKAEDIGGHVSRTVSLDVATGQVEIRSQGKVTVL